MSFLDFILLGAIAAAVILTVRSLRKSGKHGGCSCGCSSCPVGCHGCDQKKD